jgi:hypothetical protein
MLIWDLGVKQDSGRRWRQWLTLLALAACALALWKTASRTSLASFAAGATVWLYTSRCCRSVALVLVLAIFAMYVFDFRPEGLSREFRTNIVRDMNVDILASRRGRARFRDYGHGQKEGEVNGVIGAIREPFLHFAFANGWDAWVEWHNRYSSQETRGRLREKVPLRQIFERRPTLRNYALRHWLTRLPGWPLLRFGHVHLLRLGFLEGYPGLVQAVNVAWYEYLIKLKMKELRRRERGLPG